MTGPGQLRVSFHDDLFSRIGYNFHEPPQLLQFLTHAAFKDIIFMLIS